MMTDFLKRDFFSRGPDSGGSHVARLNFKTSRVSVYKNASRRYRKLNENSLSLSEF